MADLSEYNLATLGLWPNELVDEFMTLTGGFVKLDAADKVRVGITDPEKREVENVFGRKVLNPMSPGLVEIKSIYFARRLCSINFLTGIASLPFRLNHFSETANWLEPLQANEYPGIWGCVNLAHSIGFRLPTEQEWEVAMLGPRLASSPSKADPDLLTRSIRTLIANSNSEESHLEYTSSLGFRRKLEESGDPWDTTSVASSWMRWPGVIVRGWDAFHAPVVSRQSHRYGFRDVKARLVVSRDAVERMDACYFKELMQTVV